MTEVCSSPATREKQQHENSSPAAATGSAPNAISASPARQSSCREEHLQEISFSGSQSVVPVEQHAGSSGKGPPMEERDASISSVPGLGKSRNFRRNSGPAKRSFSTLSSGRDSVDFAGKHGGKRPKFVPPSKFLLGGNIRDPLNLNSIPEDGPSGTTPSQSPRNTSDPSSPRLGPVEIKIPKWSKDPLGLGSISEETKTPSSSFSGGKRKRKRRDSRFSDAKPTDESSGSFSDSEIHSSTKSGSTGLLSPAGEAAVMPPAAKRPRGMSFHGPRRPLNDPIVSPVREKPPSMIGGAQKGMGQTGSPQKKKPVGEEEPKKGREVQLSNRARARKEREQKFNPNAARFKYGNYDRYYGKRLPERQEDPRLKFLKADWFEGKDVLDVGCNIGHVTIIIARDFQPAKIVGLDIDSHLVGVARKNVRRELEERNKTTEENSSSSDRFPPSFAKEYGPLTAPEKVDGLPKTDETITEIGSEEQKTESAVAATGNNSCSKAGVFPKNLIFKQGNYVLKSDELLETVKEEYDTVVALSVTKWVHLNWGDAGIKRFFKRCYRNLKPGGKMVLEPQPFSTYKKRKKLTPEIQANFKAIQFRPDQFTKYLLSSEVGFKSFQVAGIPANKSKGFQRPIQIFTKPGSEIIQRSDAIDAENNAEPIQATERGQSATISVEEKGGKEEKQASGKSPADLKTE